MNFNDYLVLIRRYIYLPILLVVLVVAYSLYQGLKNPNIFTGSITFTVGNSVNVKTDETGFNNYYSLSTSSVLSDTIVGWLSSPNIVNKIYQEAGYPISNEKVLNLGKKIRSQKSALTSSVVVATIQEGSKDETQAVLVATRKVIEGQLANLTAQSATPPGLTIVSSEPTVLTKKVSIASNAIVGALAGLLLGVIASLAIGAIKENNRG